MDQSDNPTIAPEVQEAIDRHAREINGKSSRAYNMHRNMMARCYNKSYRGYARYGGRGIKVCKRWHILANFLLDMGLCPPGMTLERKDVNGDYSPDNCCWASAKDQARNRSTNKHIEHEGKWWCISALAEKYGISRAALRERFFTRKWPLDRALTAPVRRHIQPARKKGNNANHLE